MKTIEEILKFLEEYLASTTKLYISSHQRLEHSLKSDPEKLHPMTRVEFNNYQMFKAMLMATQNIYEEITGKELEVRFRLPNVEESIFLIGQPPE